MLVFSRLIVRNIEKQVKTVKMSTRITIAISRFVEIIKFKKVKITQNKL